MGEVAFVRRSLFVLAGLLIWAAHFMFIYVFNALACARNFYAVQLLGFGIVPLAIGVVTAMAVTSVVTLLIVALRSAGRGRGAQQPTVDFLNSLAVAAAMLSIIAICWSAWPVLLVPPCG